MKGIKKIDDYSVEVEKQKPQPTPTKTIYERSFLEKQLVDIQAQQDRDNEQREKEKTEVQEILQEMDKLGIVSKPVEKQSNGNNNIIIA